MNSNPNTNAKGGAESSSSSDNKTKLSRSFTFWFSFSQAKTGPDTQNKKVDYESAMKKIANFDTVEDFWGYYQHMVRPEQLPSGYKFLLFQENIKPMWEDEANQYGGRFIMHLKKAYGNRFWEDLLLSYIGEQCDENDFICGLIVSGKEKEILIEIWIKYCEPEARDKIKLWIKTTLGLSEKSEFEFREHPRESDQQGGRFQGQRKNYEDRKHNPHEKKQKDFHGRND